MEYHGRGHGWVDETRAFHLAVFSSFLTFWVPTRIFTMLESNSQRIKVKYAADLFVL